MTFEEFLVQAKIVTYATVGEGGERRLEDGAFELEFADSPFRYRDRYFGFNPFLGQEVVWRDKVYVWGMNYFGQVHSDRVPTIDVFEFLKLALQKPEPRNPVRGPIAFCHEDYQYVNHFDGWLSQFHGPEMIYFQHEHVYTLRYHGGNCVALV